MPAMVFVLGEEKPRDNLEVFLHWLCVCVLIHLSSLSLSLSSVTLPEGLGTWTGGRLGRQTVGGECLGVAPTATSCVSTRMTRPLQRQKQQPRQQTPQTYQGPEPTT